MKPSSRASSIVKPERLPSCPTGVGFRPGTRPRGPDSRPYIVMEYGGQTLRDVLNRRRRCHPPGRWSLMEPVLAALATPTTPDWSTAT